MANLILKPQTAKFTAIHPATGKDYFENNKGKKIKGVFEVAGISSPEFYKYINQQVENDITHQDDVGIHNMIAALIVGWDDTGFIDVKYSAEEALDLISKPENNWLKLQLQTFMEDGANFFTGGVKDSKK